MSAKNGVGQTPPPPLVSQKSEIGLPPPPPPYQKKIRNWVTLPPPLSAIIFWRTPINLVKSIFQEEISNFEINKTCVKYKKERKRAFETKNREKMCHIQ